MKRKPQAVAKTGRTAPKPDSNRYPNGWDRKRVQAVIAHYEDQTDEQAIAEDEAAYHSSAGTMMLVPKALVPKVEKMIARAS
jgi:hypothetical protein